VGTRVSGSVFGDWEINCPKDGEAAGPRPSKVQALDRTQRSLSLRPGRASTMPMRADYRGNGTVDLFVGLGIGTGDPLRSSAKAIPGRRARFFETG
jgi:hypothetical protein